MARSFNNARNRNDWTADRRSKRAIEGKQTKQTRKNKGRDIKNAMTGVTYGSFGEHYDEQGNVYH